METNFSFKEIVEVLVSVSDLEAFTVFSNKMLARLAAMMETN